jgi:hypothetical protein
MKKNLHYFEVSKNNLEPHLDMDYFIIEKNPEIKDYLKNIKDIKETLITIKKLKESKAEKSVVETFYEKLFEIFKSRFANCSELGCFVNACDTTRDLIQKDFDSFKKITEFYIQKREMDDRVPENWVQAIIDSNSSRKKGELGERKLIKILTKKGFPEVKNWDDFNKSKKCVARFSNETFSHDNVQKNLKIKIKTKKQGKMLDLIIKKNNEIFLLEAKHLNVGGGEQDKQVSELIDVLRAKEEDKRIHYVSFLDGTYSNKLFGDTSKRAKKRLQQRKEIERYFVRNLKNYWVNTAGFEELVDDLK